MDVEAAVARRLAQAAGVPGYIEVPEEMPDSFISVERIGGGGSMFEPCRLAVDCWAKKKERKRAHALAESVAAAVADLDEEANFFHPEVTNFLPARTTRTRAARDTSCRSRYGSANSRKETAWQRPMATTRRTSAPRRA